VVIGWLVFGWPGQVALVVFTAWFLNGLRKVFFKPRLVYVEHQRVTEGSIVSVRRQELWPPWRVLDERWLVNSSQGSSRLGDGAFVSTRHDLCRALVALIIAHDAEQELTERLGHEDKPSEASEVPPKLPNITQLSGGWTEIREGQYRFRSKSPEYGHAWSSYPTGSEVNFREGQRLAEVYKAHKARAEWGLQ
jgi:hypothetical protein